MFISGEAGLPIKMLFSKQDTSDKNNISLLFSHARGGLELFLRKADLGERKTILVPTYICQDLIGVILCAGYEVGFYGIDEKLNPIKEDLLNKISDQTAAVLIVHYFGFFINSIGEIKKSCDQKGVILIEDCAHLIYDNLSINKITGDLAIFSLRKIFPLSDGGVLYSKTGLLKNKMDKDYDKLPEYNLAVVKNILILLFKHYLMMVKYSRHRRYKSISNDNPDAGYLGPMKISRLSRRLFNGMKSEIFAQRIRQRRRENYQEFAAQLMLFKKRNNNICDAIFDGLGEGDVPYFFPLRFHLETDKLVDRLRNKGIPVITWPTLDKGAANFTAAEQIKRNLLFFPLHEGINKMHIRFMINEFERALCAI